MAGSIRRRPDRGADAWELRVFLVRALLHRSCRLARKWSGNRLPNPVADTELPAWAPEERPRPVRSPDPEEVLAVLDAARYADPQVATLIRLVTATGMRRGEACALRWGDIDRDGGTIMVDEGAVGTAEGMVTRSPKTRPSTRRVAVDADTLAQVGELRRRQQSLADRAEVTLGPEGFVLSFEPGGGTPPHPDTMSHAFAEVRDAAGVPSDVHLHSLRHFQSTHLDNVISEAQKQARLGWSTVHMARH